MLKSALFQRNSITNFNCIQSFVKMKPLQLGQKPSVLCDALRASLPAHVKIEEHDYFLGNMFLLLLPPLTRAQCLATKITSITELACFADCVHCQTPTATAPAAINSEIDSTCAMTIQQPLPSPPSSDLLCFYHKMYGAQAQKFKGNGCLKSLPANKSTGNASRLGGSS